MDNVVIDVAKHNGVKCPRCWHYHHVTLNHDYLCDRCVNVLLENFPDHESIPYIKVCLRAQLKKWCTRPDEKGPCDKKNCCKTFHPKQIERQSTFAADGTNTVIHLYETDTSAPEMWRLGSMYQFNRQLVHSESMAPGDVVYQGQKNEI